jgi:hypothetical protein
MKKIIFYLIFGFQLVPSLAQQAPPQGINYQAVVYVPINNQLAGQNITGQQPADTQQVLVKFTLEEGFNGSLIYEETHSDTTDQYGLLNTVIGTGTPTVNSPGLFNQIDWSVGDPYLRVSITLIHYSTTVSSYQKLWSVPYALYADHANTANSAYTSAFADSSGYADLAGNGITGVVDNGNGTLTFNYFDGSSYTTGQLTGVGSIGTLNEWKLTGNAGTDPSNNFIGTTDSTDWVIRTDSLERVRVKASGRVGIGTSNPTSDLQVTGISKFGQTGQFNIALYMDTSSLLNSLIPLNSYGTGLIEAPKQGNLAVRIQGNHWDDGFFVLTGPDNNIANNPSDKIPFKVLRNGWVGVGKSKPQNTFHVNNDVIDADSSFIVTEFGNVGIGKNTPTEKLEIENGGIRINGFYGVGFTDQPFGSSIPNGNEGAKIYFDNTILQDPNRDYLVLEKKDGSTVNPDGGIVFANRGNNGVRTPSMIIDGLGQVGIGTLTPARKLHVSSVMRLEPIPVAPSSPSKGDMYFDSTLNKLRVYDGTTWHNCW